MIPFAICGAQLHIQNNSLHNVNKHNVNKHNVNKHNKNIQNVNLQNTDIQNDNKESFDQLEIRLLEISPYFCTFRLPLSFADKMNSINAISFRFSLRNGTERVELLRDQFTLTRKNKDNIPNENGSLQNKYYTVIEMKTSEPKYRDLATRLSYEYLDYIEAKLTLDDAELAHRMTGIYPKDKEDQFFSTKEEQIQYFRQYIRENYKAFTWNNFKINIDNHNNSLQKGLQLESHSDYDTFLKIGVQAFAQKRNQMWGLDEINHPLASMPVSIISVGNAYCPHQMPSLEQLKEILKKCFEEEAFIKTESCIKKELYFWNEYHVILQLPPVSELCLEKTLHYLSEIHEWFCQYNEITEISDYIQSPDFENRGTARDNGLNIEIMVNDEGLHRWLETRNFKHFNITRGFLLNKSKRDARSSYIQKNSINNTDSVSPCVLADTAFLPWYQMNTGTFCPLYAKITTGDRGRSVRVKECPGYCEKTNFLYPMHLHMMGRFNSVFGADLDTLCDGNHLPNNIKRILL